jgi:hypothetical protein
MKDNPLQVLPVEDSAGDARLLREMFSKEMTVEVQEFMNEEISRRTVSHGQ